MSQWSDLRGESFGAHETFCFGSFAAVISEHPVVDGVSEVSGAWQKSVPMPMGRACT